MTVTLLKDWYNSMEIVLIQLLNCVGCGIVSELLITLYSSLADLSCNVSAMGVALEHQEHPGSRLQVHLGQQSPLGVSIPINRWHHAASVTSLNYGRDLVCLLFHSPVLSPPANWTAFLQNPASSVLHFINCLCKNLCLFSLLPCFFSSCLVGVSWCIY